MIEGFTDLEIFLLMLVPVMILIGIARHCLTIHKVKKKDSGFPHIPLSVKMQMKKPLNETEKSFISFVNNTIKDSEIKNENR